MKMKEIDLLIKHTEETGFKLVVKGDNLAVTNGTELPIHLKQQLIFNKDKIIKALNKRNKDIG